MAKKHSLNELYNPAGTLYNIDSVIEIISPTNSYLTTTITAKNDFTIISELQGGGFSNEQTSHIMSGTVPIDKQVSIATIEVKADVNKYITKSPYLKCNFKKNLKLILNSVSRTHNKITTYNFDLVYKNNIKTTRATGLRAELNYTSTSIDTRTINDSCVIDHIAIPGGNFGTISQDGGPTPIKIYGTPGAAFELAINENTIDATGPIQKHDDVSILSTENSKSTTSEKGYNSIATLTGTIGLNGVYKFPQKFPSAAIQNTRATAAVSTAKNLFVANPSNIAVGDRVYAKGIPDGTAVLVDSVDTTTRRVVTDTNITVAEQDVIVFKRKRSYSLDFIPNTTCTFGPNISTSDPSYRMTQYIDPTLTIKLSTAGTAMTVTHATTTAGDLQGGDPTPVATGLAAGAEHYTYYQGKAGGYPLIRTYAFRKGLTRKYFNLTYIVYAQAGGTAFSASRTPIYSFEKAINLNDGVPSSAPVDSSSDFTNTLLGRNGGTSIQIYTDAALSTNVDTNDTYTLSLKGEIRRWGVEDVTIELDLDRILTVS